VRFYLDGVSDRRLVVPVDVVETEEEAGENDEENANEFEDILSEKDYSLLNITLFDNKKILNFFRNFFRISINTAMLALKCEKVRSILIELTYAYLYSYNIISHYNVIFL